MAAGLTAAVINGFIIGECFGGLTEMKLLLVIMVLVLLFGPLRRWAGRHWALLLSTSAGAVIGLFIGGFITAKCGPAYGWLPLAGALTGAFVAIGLGPKWLRDIERDGKNGRSRRRH
jgi:hypothetical protein